MNNPVVGDFIHHDAHVLHCNYFNRPLSSSSFQLRAFGCSTLIHKLSQAWHVNWTKLQWNLIIFFKHSFLKCRLRFGNQFVQAWTTYWNFADDILEWIFMTIFFIRVSVWCVPLVPRGNIRYIMDWRRADKHEPTSAHFTDSYDIHHKALVSWTKYRRKNDQYTQLDTNKLLMEHPWIPLTNSLSLSSNSFSDQ